MLDPDYQKAVSSIVSKKQDKRAKMDVPGDPTTHFFEQLLDDAFMKEEYVVVPPNQFSELPEEERDDWEPNDAEIFKHERTGVWLRGTWEDYTRPKYKKALDRWNKDTGGGDGTPASFVDYCGSDRWLVFLF